MTHRVIYSPSFLDDIAEQVDYLQRRQVAQDIIECWFSRLFDRLDQLCDWPRRYPVDERTSGELGFEVRKLVYSKRIITYQVDDVKKVVRLLTFVHGARRR